MKYPGLRRIALSPLVLALAACSGDSGGTSGASGMITSASTSATSTSTGATGSSGSTAGTDSASGSSAGGTESGSAGSSTTGGALKLDVGFDTSTSGGTMDEGCKKVDLLLVIDDSGSMSDQQDKLTAAFPSFIQTIDEQLVQKKGIDYRIGVLSTDMAGTNMCVFIACGQGHRGRLQHKADRLKCNDVPPGKWIEAGPVDTVAKQFTCIASMDGGEFDEMPLEALRAGLIDRVQDMEAYNAGFIREDALLVMIMITDEDDQSVKEVPEMWDAILGPGKETPVIEYQQLFIDLKGGDKDRFVAVAISGPKTGSCGPMDSPTAVAAPRIHQFLELNTPNSYWGNICDEDFTTPLAEALEVIKSSCETFPPV